MYALVNNPSDDRPQTTSVTAAATTTTASTSVSQPNAARPLPTTQANCSDPGTWAHHAGPPTTARTVPSTGPSSTSRTVPSTSQEAQAAGPSASWSTYRNRPSAVQTDTENDTDDEPGAPVYSSSDEFFADDVFPPGSKIKSILGSYLLKRNFVPETVFDPYHRSRAVIEFVNLKYIDNNLRSVGMKEFGKNLIMEAQVEFESFENWFTRKINYVAEKQYIRDLRIPMFCHLYLSLYPEYSRERMLEFLEKFKYLFISSGGVLFLEELRNITDIEQLSCRLSLFRRNKYVYTISPEFFGYLNEFFQHHFLLKMVFQEWFDVSYDTNVHPWVIFDEYYNKNLPKMNNRLKAKAPKQNNNENVFSVNLSKKKLNSTQNKNSQTVADYKNNCYDHLRPSTSKGYFGRHQNSINTSADNCSQSKPCNDTESKTAENSDLSSEEPTDSSSEEPRTGSSKNDDKRKHQVYDQSSSYERESRSHKKLRGEDNVDSCLQNKSTRHRKKANIAEMLGKGLHSNTKEVGGRIILHVTRKPNRLRFTVNNRRNEHNVSCPTDSSRPSPSSSDEEEKMTSNAEENPKKMRKKYKLRGRRSSYCSSCSSSDSSCEGSKSSEDSNNYFLDEETEMRNYFRTKNKLDQHFYKTSYLRKIAQKTKIDAKNLDDDSYLCTMRQITLTNCSKLLCSTLTADHKYVAAGSVDSLIYLWERSNIPTEVVDMEDVLSSIESKIGEITNFVPSDQSKNFIELLDKSDAKILRGHGGPIYDFAELPSAKILLSASNDKTFRAWDLVSKLCLEVYNEHEHRTWCIAACPYSLQVATGSCDGASCLWFLNYKRPLRIFMGHHDDVLVLKFHPNQVHLATGSSDKSIRLYELTTGSCKRILIGHSDYITSLEFHTVKPNILASASGSGEIIVWDVPIGAILWSLRVGKAVFSELAWLTNDVLLASLTTGIVLKCDTTEDYVNLSKKVKGFTTKFDRLMSLKIVGTTAYTIGIQGKAAVPKLSSMRNQQKSSQQVENLLQRPKQHQQQQRFQKESSPVSKLYFPRHIIEKNGNSVRPLESLSSTMLNNSSCDPQFKLSIKPKNVAQLSQDGLQSPPFNLPDDVANKSNSEYQSNHKKFIQNPSKRPRNTQKNASPSVQRKVQKTKTNNSQTHVQPTNGQFSQQSTQNVQKKRKNSSQQLTNTNALLQAPLTNNQQHKIGSNQLKINLNFQQQNLRDPNMNSQEKNQLQLHDRKETNLATNIFVQQQKLLQNNTGNNIQISNTNVQQQQLQPVIRTRLTPQMIQKSVVQQEQQQQLQLQNRVGNNVHIASTNVLQQQRFQQLKPNTLLAKVNVQQRQPQQQTSIRLANVNVPQSMGESIPGTNLRIYDMNAHMSKPVVSSLSPSGVPIRFAIKQQKPTLAIQSSTLEQSSVDEYDRVRLSVMENLLQANPDLFLSGQTVLNELKNSTTHDMTEP